MPGGRLKLDPRDLYALGAHRGGIDERWFSSTTKAANGPLTAPDEGLSYIEFNGRKALLKEAIETEGDRFLGADVMQRKAAGTCSASSSTTSDRSRTTSTRTTSSPRGSGRRASPRRITSRRSTTSRTTISRTPSWA